MKLLTLAMIMVATTAYMMVEDDKITFVVDSNYHESVGLRMEGELDPYETDVEGNMRMRTYLRLADQYVPLGFAEGLQGTNLEYTEHFAFQLGPISFGGYVSFNMNIGWSVDNVISTDAHGEDLQLTYTPFAAAWINTDVNTTTDYIGFVSVGAHIDVIHFYVPIQIQLEEGGNFCFNAAYEWQPVAVTGHIFTHLIQCSAEIIDEIVEQVPIHLNCERVAPVNALVITKNLTG